ncbi:MAG TPA: integrase core domain-containing protein [Phycisphaerales bacterium]|nr:integrase core domain-containing protein [Phycisphaerales bacterium]
MPNPIRRLLTILAGSGRDELHRQVQYLKAENEVLRSKIAGQVRVTPQERARLVRLGKPLGTAIRSLVSIVRPETFLKWVRQAGKRPKQRKAPAPRPGRPRTPEQVRTIVLRIARETGFGYVRILGELKKLGIGGVSRSTVVNVLKQAGLPTGPARGERTWDQFLKAHAKTLWACDFLTLRVLTATGLKYAFALVFVHPRTRRAHVSTSTTNPDAAWCEEVIRRFVASLPRDMSKPRLLLRDRDGKFAAGDGAFGKALAEAGIKSVQLPHRSPNLNAHVERLIQSIQTECLDHFVVLGTRHLDHLLDEYIDYHNRRRPHSSLGFATPLGERPSIRAGPIQFGRIRCEERLGGVLKHYYWKAA